MSEIRRCIKFALSHADELQGLTVDYAIDGTITVRFRLNNSEAAFYFPPEAVRRHTDLLNSLRDLVVKILHDNHYREQFVKAWERTWDS